MHILMVEDAPKSARALKEGLEREAREVTGQRLGGKLVASERPWAADDGETPPQ